MQQSPRRREGFVIFITEAGKKIGVLAVVQKGKFDTILGINAIPYTAKSDSVSSLRRLIAELPQNVQSVVRDYARDAKSTMTQDEECCPLMLRSVEVPKHEVVNIKDTHCLSNDDVLKIHPMQGPRIEILKQAYFAKK